MSLKEGEIAAVLLNPFEIGVIAIQLQGDGEKKASKGRGGTVVPSL